MAFRTSHEGGTPTKEALKKNSGSVLCIWFGNVCFRSCPQKGINSNKCRIQQRLGSFSHI